MRIAKNKVVGIGFNKTGTSTLGECMSHWGFKHISFSPSACRYLMRDNMNALIRMARKYESFEDWPWALIYREMDDNFPNTKFILTRRKDADTWFKSLCNHAKKTGPSNFRKFVYGHKMPEAHQQRFVQRYLNHIDSVRAYFRNRSNDFLEVCWEEGDGWAQLADFLKVEAPDRAFPHANKSLSN